MCVYIHIYMEILFLSVLRMHMSYVVIEKTSLRAMCRSMFGWLILLLEVACQCVSFM